jgi:hypothetical protein
MGTPEKPRQGAATRVTDTPQAPDTFTRAEVTEILKRQIKACSEVIDASTLSRYTASLKIQATKLVTF